MFGFRTLNSIRRPLTRAMSSKESLIDLTVDREGIALITMKRLPVNSLNLELLQEICSSLDVVQKNQYKGLIFTSATRVFSAGLDLNEFKSQDLQRLRKFWSALQDLFLKLYGSGETTTTAAINGYTAAGGCVLTLLCDYRVMVLDDKAKIGLNDTIVGLVPAPWVRDLMNRTMGERQAEIAMTASTMFNADEALKVNLIDETASDKEDAIEKCKKFIRRYDNIPIKSKATTKKNLREETIRLFQENRKEDLQLFTEGILDPNVQERIDLYMRQLKSKKK